MFFNLTITALLSTLAVLAAARHHDARSPSYISLASHSLHRRSLTGQTIAFSCYGGGGDCECPTDNNGDSGVLINVYPGYQCAYPNGACTWDDKVRIQPCTDIRGVLTTTNRRARCRTPRRRTAPRMRRARPRPGAAAPSTTTAIAAFSSTSSPATSVPMLAARAPGTS